MSVTLEQFGLDKLSVDEKSELIGLLEESVCGGSDAFAMSPEQEAELIRRVVYARANPGQGTPWEVVRDAALARSRARQGQ